MVATCMARSNGSLPLTSLCNRQQIKPHFDGRNTITLNWGRCLVAAKLNVSQHGRVQSSIFKRTNRVNAHKALLGHVDLLDPV